MHTVEDTELRKTSSYALVRWGYEWGLIVFNSLHCMSNGRLAAARLYIRILKWPISA